MRGLSCALRTLSGRTFAPRSLRGSFNFFRLSLTAACRILSATALLRARSLALTPCMLSAMSCCRIRRLSFAIRTKQDAGRKPVAWNLCNAPIYVDYFIDSSRNGRWGWALEVAMHCSGVAPSSLPSLFLPCPHCGARMVITAVGPALPADGANANDLDVTHGCGQCGTKLTRIRPLASAA